MNEQNDTPVWFITGCSTGFGRELAKLILQKGWRAVITARNTEKISDLAEANEGRALALELDVTQVEQVKEAVKTAEETFGRIDVLVNNAGYGYFSGIEEGEEQKIREQFETNIFGLLNMMKAVLPGMRSRRKGHIVNFSSIAGLRAFPAGGYYHATKFAVEALSESLSHEVNPLGIKVLLVEPGPFRTDFAGRSNTKTPVAIDDYQETVGKRMKTMLESSGKQVGDPIRGCEAIITAVESGENHLRLLLGEIAYNMALEKLDMMKENFEAWKDLTLGADYPESER